jgi:hypothetical protein
MRARIFSLTDSKALKAQLVENQRPASFNVEQAQGFRVLLEGRTEA